MAQSTTSTLSSPSNGVTVPARVTRVRLLAEVEPSASIRREFRQPRHAFAVEESSTLDAVGREVRRSSSAGDLVIVSAPTATRADRHEPARALLLEWAAAAGERALRVRQGPDEVEWCPGFAIVSCRPEATDDVTAALVDFAFYEGELRSLESAIEAAVIDAQDDFEVAHKVRYRDREHWIRLATRMEAYARMRVAFARLEPEFDAGARKLPPAVRQWLERFSNEAEVEARLEAASDRLEALEELYEGANQRIAEYRWYREGHLLELCIVLILLVEAILMSVDIHAHYRDRQLRDHPEVRAE